MTENKDPPRFNSLLKRWDQTDICGASTFQSSAPKKKKSEMMMQNEAAIREYKKYLKANTNFKDKIPTRGMSVKHRPAQLQDVFGAKMQVRNVTDFKPPVYKKGDSEVQTIEECIKHSFFFDDLTPKEKQTMIAAFEPIEVSKGTEVIKQGEPGDYFYIIGEGEVTFLISNKVVGTAKTGESFGELALLYASPRAATVWADSEPTKLFRVEQQTFRCLLQKQTKIMEAEKERLLNSIDFLQEIDGVDTKRLGRAMSPKYFEPGTVLVKKGDEGDAFYVILEGEVEVTDISIGPTSFDDITLKDGDYFGERALATNEPRVANVTALTSGVAFSIDGKTFEKVLGQFSRLIMKSQDRRLLEGIELLQLSDITEKQFEELSHLIADKTFEEGEKLFNSLQETEAVLYLVRGGSVQLSGGRSDLIKPGGYFGEDLLLLDTRQSLYSNKRSQTKVVPAYTATATAQCQCGVLTLSDCRTIFDTTQLVDMAKLGFSIAEEEGKGDEDDANMPAAVAPSTKLDRVTTRQWLKKESKETLRSSVKTTVPLRMIEKHSVLGEGQFGEVWLVSGNVPKYGRQHLAMKIQKIEDPTRGNSVTAIQREIDVLALMDHPFIVTYVHHYEDPENFYILMGLVHGGELFDVIHTENEDGTWSSGIPESDAKFYAMVVSDTLDYMHRKQFVYRDLKPENILIDKDGYPIICDLGFTKFVSDKTYTLCGTPNYLAPEVIMNRGHNASCDHWALGVVIYEMVAGENPFFYDGMPQMELFQTIVRKKFYPLPNEVSDGAFDVINELLEKDPSRRLGSLAGRGKDIITKDWFKELNLDDTRQKKVKAPFIPQNSELESLVARASVQSEGSEGSISLPTTGDSIQNPGNMSGLSCSSTPTLHHSSKLNHSSLLSDSDSDED